MPSNWSMIDNSFPTFTGDERPRDQIAQLQNYLMLLVEQLKYQLNNLSAVNWNDAALQDLQADTTKDVENELSHVAGDLSQTATDLQTILQRLTGVENDLADLELWKATHETVHEELEESISDLTKSVVDMDADLGNLFAVMKPDGTGGAEIGAEGKEIRLVGRIYINGILFEGETE